MRATIVPLAFLMVLLASTSLLRTPVDFTEKYVYYGVIPSRLYVYLPHKLTHATFDFTKPWSLDEKSVKTSGFVAVVASKDNTNVRVYTLIDDELVSEAVLDALDRHFVSLPNGTVFKVVSDQFVTVLLLPGDIPKPDAFEGVLPYTFYPAVNGAYVGKEFVFMASQSLSGLPYHLFALEPAEVTLTRDDAAKQSFKLEANSHKPLQLKAFSVYRVQSTGNLMIQSGGPGPSFFVPSADGGFVGKRFYSCSATIWDPIMDYGFRISALEDTKVTIWDLEFKRVIQELEVKEGESVPVKPRAEDEAVIAVESDRPVTFSFVHGGDIRAEGPESWSYGAGVTYVGIGPNEETAFFLPTETTVEVYIFAYEDTLVKVDDIAQIVKADTYLLVSFTGFHKIVSEKNVVVQVVHWPIFPQGQGISEFGVTVPCVQAVSVSSEVTLTQ